ncbi:MAG: gamma-glutamyltransferase family protein [Phycisphaerales bacterium]
MDWSLPYPSSRSPVLADNVVASSQPLASQAGLSMLTQGGTAVDAAIAAAAVLTVTEPTSNGLGSDAFAIVWDGGAIHGLNASGRAPRSQTIDSFGGAAKVPAEGWLPVTVPGAISAWMALSARFGKLPFERLLQPAIRIAKEGWCVAPQTAEGWRKSLDRFGKSPAFAEWRRVFAPGGTTPAPGERTRLPLHAATLQAIAESRGEEFYRGRLAAAMADAAARDGAWLSREDLAAHRPEWVHPWSVPYRDLEVHELPPNGQGVTALLALGIAARSDLGSPARECPDVLHVQIEAVKAAFADAHAHVAEPDPKRDAALQALLLPAALDARAASLDLGRAREWAPQPLPGAGTVYLCAADAGGMMISYIQSNYQGFGSGVVIPETGISMQNRGACFVLTPGHPNCFAPGKRPYQTIIPGFITRGREAVGPFGVMGGFMQPQGHLQVVVRQRDQGLNPQAALDAPRFQLMDDGTVAFEPGFPDATLEELAARGHRVVRKDARSVLFGGGQIIVRLPGGGYAAGSDARRDGQAVGY